MKDEVISIRISVADLAILSREAAHMGLDLEGFVARILQIHAADCREIDGVSSGFEADARSLGAEGDSPDGQALDLGPPRTIDEIFARKARARSRFEKMSHFEKMEIAIEMHRDRTALKGRRDPSSET